MRAIIVATVTGKCLPVLLASIEAYVPEDVALFVSAPLSVPVEHQTRRAFTVLINDADNYGDAYNKLARFAFNIGRDSLIVCNDDVVFNPDTYEMLVQDVESLDPATTGWVAVRSNAVRSAQNIKFMDKDEMFEAWVVSPILGCVSKHAWVDYLPLNDYSDDVQCMDMTKNGLIHYVSRAYAHHVGSHTIKTVGNPHYGRDREILKQQRPEYYKGF